MTPLISIIIPCYNDAQYIEQAVNSVLNQTYTNIEVIVVDDGSDEETKKVLKKLEHRITKLISQENKGQSTARNVGIRESKGEYILALDSDDYFEPTFCEKAIDIFNKTDDAMIVTCQANLIFDNGLVDIYIPKGGTVSAFMYDNSALGTSMFKKKDWSFYGGYDESMRNGFEDWEFFIRILKEGGIAKVIQEPLYNYRKRTYSTTTIANKFKYDLLFYIYIKHKDLFIEDYENFVYYLLERINVEEKNKLKYINEAENKSLIFFRTLKSFSLKQMRKIKF